MLADWTDSIWFYIVAFVIFIVLLYMRFGPVKGLKELDANELDKKLEQQEQKEIRQRKNKEKVTKPDFYLLDVRAGYEFHRGNIPGSINVPVSKVTRYAKKNFEKDEEIILVCLTGSRSKLAAKKLMRAGFTNLAHLKGGLIKWGEDD